MGCVPSGKQRLEGGRTNFQVVDQLAKQSLICKHPEPELAAKALLEKVMDRTSQSVLTV